MNVSRCLLFLSLSLSLSFFTPQGYSSFSDIPTNHVLIYANLVRRIRDCLSALAISRGRTVPNIRKLINRIQTELIRWDPQ